MSNKEINIRFDSKTANTNEGIRYITCEEIMKLKAKGVLIPGKQYCIEDFHTFYYQNQYEGIDLVDYHQPIIVTANTTENIRANAMLSDGITEIKIELYDTPIYPSAGIFLIDKYYTFDQLKNIRVIDSYGNLWNEISIPDGRFVYIRNYAELTSSSESIPSYLSKIDWYFFDEKYTRLAANGKLTRSNIPTWYIHSTKRSKGYGEIIWMKDNNGNEAPFDIKAVTWIFDKGEVGAYDTVCEFPLSFGVRYKTFDVGCYNVKIQGLYNDSRTTRYIPRIILVGLNENLDLRYDNKVLDRNNGNNMPYHGYNPPCIIRDCQRCDMNLSLDGFAYVVGKADCSNVWVYFDVARGVVKVASSSIGYGERYKECVPSANAVYEYVRDYNKPIRVYSDPTSKVVVENNTITFIKLTNNTTNIAIEIPASIISNRKGCSFCIVIQNVGNKSISITYGLPGRCLNRFSRINSYPARELARYVESNQGLVIDINAVITGEDILFFADCKQF